MCTHRIKKSPPQKKEKGFSLLELLFTFAILSIGLLGIVALQMRLQTSELEAYNRSQALILLSDIADRIILYQDVASCFDFSDSSSGTPYIGTDGDNHLGTPLCDTGDPTRDALAVTSITELDERLKGAGETLNEAQVGGFQGARACISYDPSTTLTDDAGETIEDTGQYTIVVSWQGISETITPSVNCANGSYGGGGLRRSVSTTLRLGNLAHF
ncbi:type IV pilus modification PilV family protein [Magnetococcales bacterium HHB-1]